MEKRLMEMQKALTKEGCSLLKRRVDEDYIIEPHWHDYFEMEIIQSGNALHNYNGNVYRVSRGDAFILNYFDFHAISSQQDLNLLNICFSPDVLYPEIRAQAATHKNNITCKLDEKQLLCINSLFEQIQNEQNNREDFSSLLIKAKVNEIAAIILRASKENVKNTQPQQEKSTPQLIQKAIVYIYDNFKKDISLGSAAKELFVSPNYLGHVFKNNTGLSFSRYLCNLRLRCACTLLESTTLSASEIAFECGYGSVEYFFSSFKKYLGTTPAKYRDNASHVS